MKYNTVGAAYCYGMETEAGILSQISHNFDGIKLVAVSCTSGSLAQDEVNLESCIHKVSCNPIVQATQLNVDGADFVITVALRLGHDVLFNSYLGVDTTTFVVKDQLNNYNPIQEVRNNLKI